MPLQQSGSRPKQMIFHRESNSADGFFEYDRNTSNRQPESFFWISENPKSDKLAVRRNAAIMVRKPPEIRIDSSQTAQSPLSPLHFDWGFNDNSASGSMDKSVDESVGGQGNKSTPNLTKVESTPIEEDVGSLSPTISKSKSCVSLRSATRTLQPSPINDNNQHHNRQPRYHYFPQTLAPPKLDSGDAPLATQAQTCSNTGMVFSEKEIPQQAQGKSKLRLHSYKREAQATSSDKLMEGEGKEEGSNINLFHNPNTSSLLNHLINDKGNPIPTITSIPSIPQTPTTTKKLIRSTKSYDRFILRSREKSFFHFHSHQNNSHQQQDQQQQSSHSKKSISTSASCSNLQKMVEFTDNVEQLIRETDEAFQAVGFALGDAKAATRGFQQFENSKAARITGMSVNDLNNMNVKNINNTIVTRQNRSTYSSKPLARTNSISKRNQMQNSNFLNERPSSTSLSGKSPVPRSSFNSKAKKSISPKQKKNTTSDKASRKSLPHPHSSARWNLGDVTASMADVFKGKFTRLEADEMLTPDRLQQLEEKAEKAKLDNERKASLENAQTEAARNTDTVKDADGIASAGHARKIDADKKLDTNITSSDSPNSVSPTEPFHLEHLLPRINNDKDKTSNSTQSLGSSSPLPFTSADVSEYSENDHQRGRKALSDVSNPDYAEIDAIEQAFEDLNFPSPPRDSPHSPSRLPRSRSNTGMTSLLPTIPEISPLNILAPRTPKRSFSQDSEYSQDSSTSSVDYIQLPSTPYTLTSPLFRHGPIRLEHVYHRSNRDSLSAPEFEEALDWTAFQMAISGTMDDGTLGASEESIWEADEAEVESIFDWWSGFGYPGIGRLVKEPPVSRRKRGKSLAATDAEKSLRKIKDGRDNRATTIGLGLGFGIPSESSSGRSRTPEYQGGLWVETIRDSAPQVVEAASGPTLGARRDVALKVNVPEPKIDDDDDNDSLPPSPINLVKIKDEYIPMGYNLGHDLGIS
ncbi:uncharacterized protein Bfra_008946 [Botrytis fragariae]|uniref:Uncharacterized protein n=1 Tax=Botrytis fragariae TaxID=1964551 RepID=A0A8H6EHC4_9HELO|nr:uncharacterized protein Bfra_008946 [Botrytis fragariae]KAF5871920.1 hypothetical protein Bfra_008946 [Botrytis fragariae]